MDDGVEMEFISVLGVLIPMDVAKGVSKEARNFSRGDFLAGEAEEKVDTNQVTNGYFCEDQFKVSQVSGHTEIKCNQSSSELRLKRNQKNKIKRPKRNPGQHELVQLQEQYAEPRKWKKLWTETKANADCYLPPEEKQLQNHNKKQSSRTPGMKRRSSEAKLKSVLEGTSSVEIVDPTTNEKWVDVKPISSTSTLLSTVTTEFSPITGIAKRPLKRSRRTDEEVAKYKVTVAPPRSKITGTWKLESDDEKKSNKQVQKSNKLQACKSNSSSDQRQCVYPECTQPARYKARCAKHNVRSRCSLPDCTKFAHSGGKCIAHGGGTRCMENGCDSRARSQGKCYRHGGGILCSHPMCTTRAKSKGKCVAHGGGTICSQRGCKKLVTANGKCIAHGGWNNCSHPGCGKRVQLRGKCYEHSESDAGVKDLPKNVEDKKSTTRFRRATIKSASTSDDKPTKRCRRVGGHPIAMEKGTNSKPLDQRAKRMVVKTAKVKVPTELEDSTMSLRSGQRINLFTQSLSNGDMFEEDALQLALKLSEIEY